MNTGRLMVGPTIPTPRHRKPHGRDPQMLKSFLSHHQVMSCIHDQSTNQISQKNRPRCYSKSPTAQDAFRPIPGLIHQLCWGDRKMGTAILCIHMAGLIQKVAENLQKYCLFVRLFFVQLLFMQLSFDRHTLRCALIGINSVWKLQQT